MSLLKSCLSRVGPQDPTVQTQYSVNFSLTDQQPKPSTMNSVLPLKGHPEMPILNTETNPDFTGPVLQQTMHRGGHKYRSNTQRAKRAYIVHEVFGPNT